MATSTTSSNINAGIQSIGGNRQAARLKSYNDNLAERQVYDTTSELLAGQIQQQEKQNKFISNALGIKNSPDHTKMWNSHHALLSEEYDAMFNDDVLKAVSQDEMLSAKWLADLNELNQRINQAEQFFTISFGDPSKGADQASYSGWMVATQNGEMQYNDYWKTKGLSTKVTKQEVLDKVTRLDTKAHESVSYIPGQGFDVEYIEDKEDLFDFSPQKASTIFFAPTEQAVFDPPINYANDASTYDLYKNNSEEGLRENLRSRKPQMELDVAEFARKKAIETAEDEKEKARLEAMTASQYRDKIITDKTFDTQYQLFETAVVDAMKTRKSNEEKSAQNKATNKRTTPPEGDKTVKLTPISGDAIGFNITKGVSFVHNSNPGSFVRAVQIDDDGDIAALIEFGDQTETVKLTEDNINNYVDFAPGIIESYNALVTVANSLNSPIPDNLAKKIEDSIKKVKPNFSLHREIKLKQIFNMSGLTPEIKAELKNIIDSKLGSGDDQSENPFEYQ
jgi:hypothetical protein